MFLEDYAQLSIFAGLDGNQIDQISPFLVECQFPAGHTIFEQGQLAENLYILLSGEVVINYKPYDGPPLTVAHIVPGGVFGWSAALQRDAYTSGAFTLQPCIAYCLRGASLQLICSEHPETGKMLLERLASVIAARLRSTHVQVLGILTQGIDKESDCKRRNSSYDRK